MSGATLELWAVRLGLVIAGLAGWFWTQRLIGQRAWPTGSIGDGVHQLTAPLNRYLHEHPRAADALLVTTSAIIDALGIFILARSIFGPTVRPFLGLLILYALRQICQGLCALPPPEGMIWRRPGIPSLLVTYGTATDLFFSGHTAIAVFDASSWRAWRADSAGPRCRRRGGRGDGGAGAPRTLHDGRLRGDRDGALAVSAADVLAPGVDRALSALVGAAR